MSLLKTEKLHKDFGGLAAINNVDLDIQSGEIVGLIGPNGAGKTTLFNLVTGFYPPTSGQIIFKDESMNGLAPHDRCLRGIARTFQIPRPLSKLTVLENTTVGALARTSSMTTARKRAGEIVEFVGLSKKRDVLAGGLSTSDRKVLEIGRALATEPILLLLDEAASGLTPPETALVIELIKRIRERGITIVVVEHVMQVIMSISDRLVVLNYGEKIAEGTPQEVSRNERVIKAYLGATHASSK